MKKKFVCMLLALVLCVAWAVPALAADGDEFNIYRIAALKDGNYTVTGNWGGFVQIEGNVAQYKDSEGKWTPFTETMSAEAIQSFLEYATSNSLTPNGTVTEQGGSISFTDIDKGYYLIDYGNGTCGLYNWQGQDKTPQKKNDGGPGVEKKIKLANGDLVDWTTVKLGDDVEFEVTVKLPDIEDISEATTNYTCRVEDQVSSGLEQNRDVTVTIDGEEKTPGKDGKIHLSDEEFDFIRVQYDGNKHFAVRFGTYDEDGASTGTLAFLKKHAGKTLTLKYSAKVITLAEETMVETNTVELIYQGGKLVDKVRVYDFTITIDKYNAADSTGKDKLGGAKFVLEKEGEGFYWSQKMQGAYRSENLVKWIPKAPDLEMDAFLKEHDKNYGADKFTAMTRTTDQYNSPGQTKFEAISEGTYYLHEIEAPEGYAKIPEPIKIVIEAKPGEDGEPVRDDQENICFQYSINGGEWKPMGQGGVTWDEDWKQLTLSVGVPNTKSNVLLPSTGGIGTTIFYLAGGALVLGAVIVLIVKRRGKAN